MKFDKYGQHAGLGVEPSECPYCDGRLTPVKRGSSRWHWRHRPGEGRTCDGQEEEALIHRGWSEPMTAWHHWWQERARKRGWLIEDDLGLHRADIVMWPESDKRTVVEVQHSAITPATIKAREDFYGRMVWILDGRQDEGRRWKLQNFGKPVLLDKGDVVLFRDYNKKWVRLPRSIDVVLRRYQHEFRLKQERERRAADERKFREGIEAATAEERAYEEVQEREEMQLVLSAWHEGRVKPVVVDDDSGVRLMINVYRTDGALLFSYPAGGDDPAPKVVPSRWNPLRLSHDLDEEEDGQYLPNDR